MLEGGEGRGGGVEVRRGEAIVGRWGREKGEEEGNDGGGACLDGSTPFIG